MVGDFNTLFMVALTALAFMKNLIHTPSHKDDCCHQGGSAPATNDKWQTIPLYYTIQELIIYTSDRSGKIYPVDVNYISFDNQHTVTTVNFLLKDQLYYASINNCNCMSTPHWSKEGGL